MWNRCAKCLRPVTYRPRIRKGQQSIYHDTAIQKMRKRLRILALQRAGSQLISESAFLLLFMQSGKIDFFNKELEEIADTQSQEYGANANGTA